MPPTVNNSSARYPMASAIYTGTVRHQRLAPRRHAFSYSLFMMYLDLDELEAVLQTSRFWSRSRWALARFRRDDYLDPETASLSEAVRDRVQASTGQRPEGPIRLLTNLRYFGFLINPISCYYCFDREENLRWIVAEVTNTPWGERQAYVIPCDHGGRSSHAFYKQMHVSPFMPMEMTYQWHSTAPGHRLALKLQNHQNGDIVLNATLALTRKDITPGNLNRILWTYPLMTLKTALGIYWQALRLFVKRVPLHTHPRTAKAKGEQHVP